MPARTTAHTPQRVLVTGAPGRRAVEFLRRLGTPVRAAGRDVPLGRPLEQLGAGEGIRRTATWLIRHG